MDPMDPTNPVFEQGCVEFPIADDDVLTTPGRMRCQDTPFVRTPLKKRALDQAWVKQPSISDAVQEMLTRIFIHAPADTKQQGYLAWMGGSRSWDHWWRHRGAPVLEGHAPLSIRKRAAISAGNWDVFFVTNTAEVGKTLATKLCKEMNTLLSQLRQELPHFESSLEIITAGFNKRCMASEPVSGESFPGYAVLLQLRDQSYQRETRRSRRKSVERPAEAPDTSQKAFLIAFVEVFVFEGLDLADFERTYLVSLSETPQLHYLSDDGLFLFNHFISDNRISDKGLDVDTIRRDLLFQYFTSQHKSKEAVYFQNSLHYQRIWHPIRSPDVYNEKILYRLLQNAIPYIDAFVSAFNAYLMETMRAPINACIKSIDTTLKQHPQLQGKSRIAIVGGDAIRRYLGDTATSDIDAKVFYADGSSEAFIEKLQTIVQNRMSTLIAYLISNKASVLQPLTSANIRFTPDQLGGLQLPDGLRVTSVVIKPSVDTSLQFRLRKIGRSQVFPVDLFSIDYMAQLQIEYVYDRVTKFTVTHDLHFAILDIALQSFSKFHDDYIVDLGLPVASLKFLLKDLRNTYQDHALSRTRLWGQKREKDQIRWKRLKQLATTGSVRFPEPSSLNDYDVALMHDIQNPGSKLSQVGNAYEACFRAAQTLRNVSARQRLSKQKLPFQFEKLEDKLHHVTGEHATNLFRLLSVFKDGAKTMTLYYISNHALSSNETFQQNMQLAEGHAAELSNLLRSIENARQMILHAQRAFEDVVRKNMKNPLASKNAVHVQEMAFAGFQTLRPIYESYRSNHLQRFYECLRTLDIASTYIMGSGFAPPFDETMRHFIRFEFVRENILRNYTSFAASADGTLPLMNEIEKYMQIASEVNDRMHIYLQGLAFEESQSQSQSRRLQ